MSLPHYFAGKYFWPLPKKYLLFERKILSLSKRKHAFHNHLIMTTIPGGASTQSHHMAKTVKLFRHQMTQWTATSSSNWPQMAKSKSCPICPCPPSPSPPPPSLLRIRKLSPLVEKILHPKSHIIKYECRKKNMKSPHLLFNNLFHQNDKFGFWFANEY